MDKKAESKALIWVIVGVIVIFALSSGSLSNIFGGNQTPQVTSCPLQPALTAPTVTDALQPGTALTATYAVRKNDVYTGTTVPTVKKSDSVQYLVDTSNATIAEILSPFNVDCGNNPKEVQLKVYANATISIYNNAGNVVLTNAAAGGANNETKTAAGGSLNNKIHLVGNDKKTTGKQLVIVELSTPANVSSLSLSGATSVAVPNGYSRQLTNGYVAAFEIPSMDGNAAMDYNLQVGANTNYIIQGAVYTTFFAEQAFVDTDGTFKVGAFDSLNAAKWADKQTYNFMIV